MMVVGRWLLAQVRARAQTHAGMSLVVLAILSGLLSVGSGGGEVLAQGGTRQVELFFFQPGGTRPARPITFIIGVKAGEAGELGVGTRRVTESDGRFVLTLPADREASIRLLVEGDDRRYGDTMLLFTATKKQTIYPVFLAPSIVGSSSQSLAGGIPLAQYRPGRISHDDLVSAEARERYNKGLQASDGGDVETAIDEMVRAIVLAPRYAGALNQLGLLFYRLGRMAEAAATFTQGVTFGEKTVNVYLNLGVTLNRLGRYVEAVPILTNLLEAEPTLTRTRLPLAEALIQIQQWDAGMEVLQRAIAEIESLPPDMQAETRYVLARTMYREERYRGVVRELTLALASGTMWVNRANALLLLGSAHFELGQDAEAEGALRRALELGGRSVSQAHLRIGQIDYRRKRYDEAVKSLETFIRESTDPAAIREARSLLEKIKLENPRVQN